jgi:hypothetical protein
MLLLSLCLFLPFDIPLIILGLFLDVRVSIIPCSIVVIGCCVSHHRERNNAYGKTTSPRDYELVANLFGKLTLLGLV